MAWTLHNLHNCQSSWLGAAVRFPDGSQPDLRCSTKASGSQPVMKSRVYFTVATHDRSPGPPPWKLQLALMTSSREGQAREAGQRKTSSLHTRKPISTI
eukprot:3144856-Amphidinium_carterae.1